MIAIASAICGLGGTRSTAPTLVDGRLHGVSDRTPTTSVPQVLRGPALRELATQRQSRTRLKGATYVPYWGLAAGAGGPRDAKRLPPIGVGRNIDAEVELTCLGGWYEV